eukprot:jgi/Bigna1/77535/fgenesh1_pg.48_\
MYWFNQDESQLLIVDQAQNSFIRTLDIPTLDVRTIYPPADNTITIPLGGGSITVTCNEEQTFQSFQDITDVVSRFNQIGRYYISENINIGGSTTGVIYQINFCEAEVFAGNPNITGTITDGTGTNATFQFISSLDFFQSVNAIFAIDNLSTGSLLRAIFLDENILGLVSTLTSPDIGAALFPPGLRGLSVVPPIVNQTSFFYVYAAAPSEGIYTTAFASNFSTVRPIDLLIQGRPQSTKYELSLGALIVGEVDDIGNVGISLVSSGAPTIEAPLTPSPTVSSESPTMIAIPPTMAPTTSSPSVLRLPPTLEFLVEDTVFSEARTFRLTALSMAQGGPGIPTSDSLIYAWSVVGDLAIPLPIQLPNSPTLVFPTSNLGGTGVFTFSIEVTDQRSGLSTQGSTEITVVGAPLVQFNVEPLVGFALNTTFVANTTANGIMPLQFQYSTQSLLLSSFLLESNFSFVLPRGVFNITVLVRDQFGGERASSAGNITVLPTPIPDFPIDGEDPPNDPEGIELLRACDQIASLNVALQSLFSSLGINIEVDEPLFLRTSEFLENGLIRLNAAGLFELELFASRVSLTLVDDIPTIGNTLGECSRNGIFFRSNPIGPVDSPLLDQSFASYSQQLWGIINLSFQRAIRSDPGVNGTRTNVIVQDTNSLLNSTGNNVSTTDIEEFVNLLNTTFGGTRPTLFTETDLGADAGNVLSNLISNAVRLATEPLIDCNALNTAIDLLDEFLATAGGSLVPLEPSFDIANNIVLARSSRVFTDDMDFGIDSDEVQVNVVRNDQRFDATRDTAIISVNSILTSLVNCRPAPEDISSATNITSINTSIEGEDINSGDNEITIRFNAESVALRDGCNYEDLYECNFWDPSLLSFSTEGCTTSFESDGTPICTCNHLTQFVLLERQLQCEGGISNVVGFFFICTAVIYGIVALLLVYTAFSRKKKSKLNFFEISKLLFLLFQSLLSVPVSLILSSQIKGFKPRDLDPSTLLVLFALPHTLVWGAYVISLYQWRVISINILQNRLVKNMFTERPWAVYAIMAVIVSVIWTSFALFFYLQDSSLRILGPLTLALITTSIAAAILWLGRRTLQVIRSSSNSEKVAERGAILATYVLIITSLLIIQSIVLLLTVSIAVGDDGILYGLLLFYIADICMLILQVDFLRGLSGIRLLCTLKTLVTTTRSTKSSKTNSEMKLIQQRSLKFKSSNNNRSVGSSRGQISLKVDTDVSKKLYRHERTVSSRTQTVTYAGQEEKSESRNPIQQADISSSSKGLLIPQDYSKESNSLKSLLSQQQTSPGSTLRQFRPARRPRFGSGMEAIMQNAGRNSETTDVAEESVSSSANNRNVDTRVTSSTVVSTPSTTTTNNATGSSLSG